MSRKETKLEWFYRVVIPKATSVGAAVVVVGALFKIEHLPGAGVMLAVGLLTEAAIFLSVIILLYRSRKSLDTDIFNTLKQGENS